MASSVGQNAFPGTTSCSFSIANASTEHAWSGVMALPAAFRLHACMAVSANNEVIEHGDAEYVRRSGDRAGNADVRTARRSIARRVVVDENQSGRSMIQCSAYDLARENGTLIYGAGCAQLVAYEVVLGVQVQDAEALGGVKARRYSQMVEDRLPVLDHRPACSFPSQNVPHSRVEGS